MINWIANILLPIKGAIDSLKSIFVTALWFCIGNKWIDMCLALLLGYAVWKVLISYYLGQQKERLLDIIWSPYSHCYTCGKRFGWWPHDAYCSRRCKKKDQEELQRIAKLSYNRLEDEYWRMRSLANLAKVLNADDSVRKPHE